MFFVYLRQLFVVIHALDTDVLPVARDVCTFWRWQVGKEHSMHWLASFFRWVEAHVLITDPGAALETVADPAQGGYCHSNYTRMVNSDVAVLAQKYPWQTACSIAVIVVFLVLPQVFYVANKRIREWLYHNDEVPKTVQGPDPTEPMHDEALQMRRVWRELEDLRRDVRRQAEELARQQEAWAKQRQSHEAELEELRALKGQEAARPVPVKSTSRSFFRR